MAERRQRLGLSREEAAERAGTAVGYVEYVESSAGPPDVVPLMRLAGALGTSAWELLGGGVDIPPGRAAAAAHPGAGGVAGLGMLVQARVGRYRQGGRVDRGGPCRPSGQTSGSSMAR
nr:helix-turn-helix transcriptional regulator [Streptomyces sp. TLI_235]